MLRHRYRSRSECTIVMSFLKAEWRKLALGNYVVDPALLEKYLPHKTELDIWNGNCYVSLVGFMFKNTKLLGIPIPFHKDFEEVNLRFYVRYKDQGEWKRGVVFVKEIVPKPALTLVANSIYKEHYQTLPMKHLWEEKDDLLNVTYQWKLNGNWQTFGVSALKTPQKIEENSETEFITEHYWGYTKISPTTTYEYEVTHPKWHAYEIVDHQISVDFGAVYGADFAHLNDLSPVSVMLAEGSEITVENKRKL